MRLKCSKQYPCLFASPKVETKREFHFICGKMAIATNSVQDNIK